MWGQFKCQEHNVIKASRLFQVHKNHFLLACEHAPHKGKWCQKNWQEKPTIGHSLPLSANGSRFFWRYFPHRRACSQTTFYSHQFELCCKVLKVTIFVFFGSSHRLFLLLFPGFLIFRVPHSPPPKYVYCIWASKSKVIWVTFLSTCNNVALQVETAHFTTSLHNKLSCCKR